MRGRKRGSMAIWARDSIWKTPTVSARQIMSYTDGSSAGTVARPSSPATAARAAEVVDQAKRAAYRAQHPESEHIHLEQAERIQIVLVPLDDRAFRHGGILDRHQLVQAAARDHEAADVLRQMARKSQDFRACAP